MLVFLVCHNSTSSVSVPLILPLAHEQNATQSRLAARIDAAIEARALPGQSHAFARIPARPADGTNPDSRDDAQNTAGPPRNPTSSVPIPFRGPSAFVWAASITVARQSPSNTLRIRARYSGHLSGPRRGLNRSLRTGTLRFGGRPRGKGALRRNGTRLVITVTSVSNWRTVPGPGGRNRILSRAFFVKAK